MNTEKKLNSLTKLSQSQRQKALKWLARQNEALILSAFVKQRDYFFKLSNKEENKSILYLCAFYLATDELYTLLQSKKKKEKLQNLHEIGNATSLQVKQFKQHQPSEKWNKLLNIKNKIFKLIEEENLSFREVSKFLKTYHKLQVSHTYIATFYNALKELK